MHVRLLAAIGTPVVTEEGTVLGHISGAIIHPDTGKVEGFYVGKLFLSSLDIRRWTDRVVVGEEDVLSPVEDRVRLLPLLEHPRPVMGQPIRTEAGRKLGRCADVQFDLTHYALEWVFPRRLLRWGVPIPMTQILEVRHDAIIVKNAVAPTETVEEVASSLIPSVPEAA